MLDHDGLCFTKLVLFKSQSHIDQVFLRKGDNHLGGHILINLFFVEVYQILDSCLTSPKPPYKSFAVWPSDLDIANLVLIGFLRRLVYNYKTIQMVFVHA